MPIRELPLNDQITILKQLAQNEKEYDKNITLAKGDAYTLKYKYNINTDVNPITLIQESLKQQPTIQAIQKLTPPSSISKLKNKRTPLQPIDVSVNTDPDMPTLVKMEQGHVLPHPFSSGFPAIASSTPNVRPLFTLGVKNVTRGVSPNITKTTVPPTPNRAFSSDYVIDEPSDTTLEPIEEETKIIDEDVFDRAAVKRHGFPALNEITSNKHDIASVISDISDYNKRKMAPKLAAMTRQGLKDSPEYQTMQSDCRELVKYKRFLQDMQQPNDTNQIGSGLMKIGKYYAYTRDLRNGSLKLRHKNKSKIEGVPDQNITEGVKQLLLKRYNPKFPYTDEDYTKYQDICLKTGLRCKPHSKKINIWFSNLRDIQKRFLEIVGEIKAGNNNVELKNELSGISDILLKNNKMTKDEYGSIQHLVLGK